VDFVDGDSARWRDPEGRWARAYFKGVGQVKVKAHRPGRNVAAKAGLNRSILDAGWGQFLVILLAKAEGAGRQVITVNPWRTSITCHLCGAQCARPRQDTVICPAHGGMDADLNGASNILTRAGLGSGRAA
jgi:putative transposase